MFAQYLATAPVSTHTVLAAGYGPGSGRFGATLAAGIALVGIGIGLLARRRSQRGAGGRVEAVLAQAVAVTALSLGVWHWARSADGFGTGNGRAGAILATLIAVIGVGLGALTLLRAARTGLPADRGAPQTLTSER
ncbi:DUF6223 family protein [Nocardia huaxiensis]|uniref:Uncharacterized protein n=1 Tax=Nocardia huaxiensis TaxID=2755382 RepID=A0A7D6VAI5_9NOCA|nr:DUF6223 family protein [Nocardia huaxiensis]QLY29602.1 hypothetical protein H0264_30840 [Nocardia huaxiensis]UFS96827.1 DUF6223 family protein [Nocardia huaxiensis]